MSTLVSWHREENTWGDRIDVCEACGYEADSPSLVDGHEQIAHHECPQCGETFSDEHHPDHDTNRDGTFTPVVFAGQTWCHLDCIHNRLWDNGYAIVGGRLVTTVECFRRARVQVVAA